MRELSIISASPRLFINNTGLPGQSDARWPDGICKPLGVFSVGVAAAGGLDRTIEIWVMNTGTVDRTIRPLTGAICSEFKSTCLNPLKRKRTATGVYLWCAMAAQTHSLWGNFYLPYLLFATASYRLHSIREGSLSLSCADRFSTCWSRLTCL
jgi:hypothetical protein